MVSVEDGLPHPPYPFSKNDDDDDDDYDDDDDGVDDDDDDDMSLSGGILGKSGQLINYKGRDPSGIPTAATLRIRHFLFFSFIYIMYPDIYHRRRNN